MFSDTMWIAFAVIVVVLLALDLGVFNRKSHVIGVKEALIMSAFWIGIALAFNAVIFWQMGSQSGLEYTAAYVMEKALSVDNLFVFIIIFAFFGITPEYQHKILFYGIIGALVFRAIFIFAGVTLVEKFDWLLYIFGIFLLITAVKLAVQKDQKVDPDKNIVVRGFKKIMPVSTDSQGGKFFVRNAGVLAATPLFLALLVIETTDIVFAVDSIPAVMGITTDMFVVYTSNVFAILGLRSLYFALAGIMSAMYYLKYGLAVILGFVGIKMLLPIWGYHVDVLVSLGVILVVLLVAIIASVIRNRHLKKTKTAA
ncbi:tellurium resistance protein TerC [Candidatus Methanomassiliicoccus intestinalis]|uniref:Integral membrane protein TerC n=1 Tax=Methanomassiliicoccus intestinalis (strain Issoire-Mx1) TaxID=1295009 RepID=R9T7L4_METII|nr:TerC family protein [Candidatus Methanomassiliicoccus intestinalis]AGN25631.1 integral membrane protein TerC [Candidatus Methanomassiliicoccus intestinalis Issoire-Mx1]TQS80654.1 MAG: tellurium resistance protein TerC [Candidatus Methanomassiliicoccus intestinalis]